MSKLGNVIVRKNSGANVGGRRRMNLVEGANITLTVTDDAVNDEMDVTIAAAAAGGSIDVSKNSGAVISTQPELNFIEGANITLTIVDDAVNSECDITIASAGTDEAWLDQFFPYPQADSHKGAYAAGLMEDGYQSIIYQTFMIPDDISSIDTAVVMVISEGTGDLDWQCDTNGAACGEDFETNQDSIGESQETIGTAEVITCIDISDAFTGFTGGDVVGLQFIRLGQDADDTLSADVYYLGVLIQGS